MSENAGNSADNAEATPPGTANADAAKTAADAAKGANADAAKAEGASEPKELDPQDLRAKLESAQSEVLKVRDQLLRTAADFDNYRKRARKDVEDAQRKASERVLLEVLPVADNLERAVQAAQQSGDLNSVVEGVTMVLRFFEDAMARLGVERIKAVGQGFDPGLHEAIQQVESDEPAGTVVTEMTPGYRLAGKLLRPAMVAVARPRAGGDGAPPQSPLN